MQVTVNNIRVKDIISLLANLHMYYDAVDITVDPEERRVIINGTEELPPPTENNPNRVELRDKDFGDII